MKENYEEVPSIITGKDLDYLSDMFSWNYEALKKAYDYSNKVEDEEIKDLFNEAYDVFDDNLGQVLNIINGGNVNEE